MSTAKTSQSGLARPAGTKRTRSGGRSSTGSRRAASSVGWLAARCRSSCSSPSPERLAISLPSRLPPITMERERTSSLRAALQPQALREALVLRRPVFGNPWDSTEDIFACYVAVSFVEPLLLWCGGELMSSIFGFGSRWALGVFIAAALVGAAGFMTIVGRERTSLAVDVLAIGA